MTMSVIDRIREARRAHESLRAQPPSAANVPGKAELFRDVKELLDGLESAPGPSAAEEVRRAIRLLRIDAEHHAGLNDAEGFRDAAEAWEQYDLLERAFA
jgi:hypothetical protein